MVFLTEEQYTMELKKKNVSFLRDLGKRINTMTRIERLGEKKKGEIIKDIIKLTRYDMDNDIYRFRGKANQFIGFPYTLSPTKMKTYKDEERKKDEEFKKIEAKKSPEQKKKEEEQEKTKFKKEVERIGRDLAARPTKIFKFGEENKLPSGRMTDNLQYYKKAWNKEAKTKGIKEYNIDVKRPSGSKKSIGTQTRAKVVKSSNLKSSGTQTRAKVVKGSKLKSSRTQTPNRVGRLVEKYSKGVQ